MSTIVSELSVIAKEKDKEKKDSEDKPEKVKKIIKKLWKNINWMTVAKTGVKTAVGVATGTTPIMLAASIPDLIQSIGSSSEEMDKAVSTMKSFFKSDAFSESDDESLEKDISSNTEFRDFQNNFEDLLDEVGIKKLIVLIDDLDRCVPDVAIDTLEAVKLFMFTPKTAFVIAADEGMIKYAVKKHFPDVMTEDGTTDLSYGFADKYLEKIIQVPFRIPVLGQAESSIYIMLLLVGSGMKESDEAYERLRKDAIKRLQTPWSIEGYTIADIQKILDTKYESVSEKVRIAIQISKPLSANCNGNPRQIKRFINMLLLRYRIAEARGYKDIRLDVLAKMMLAEQFYSNFYKALPEKLNGDGTWKYITDEDKKPTGEDEAETITSSESPEGMTNIATGEDDDKATHKKSKTRSKVKKESKTDESHWYSVYKVDEWVKSDPSLDGINLKPYYFICKERVDYLTGIGTDPDILEAVNVLMQRETYILGQIDKLKALSDKQAERALDIVWDKIVSKGSYSDKPDGVDGIKQVIKVKPHLRKNIVDLLTSLPVADVGVWIVQGWEDAIPEDCDEYKDLKKYYERLKTEGNGVVQAALSVPGE